MADDPKKPKPKPKSKPPTPKGAPPAAMDDQGADDPMGMGASGPPMPPPFGGSPPMPGQGVDPYAALQGLIMQGPPPPPQPGGMTGPNSGGGGLGMGGMDMPMGPGPGGDIFPGGGAGMGMQLGSPRPGQDPQEDELTRALMSDIDPGGGGPPDLSEHALDPGAVGQQQMSMQQILTMLALLKGGIPTSGVPPTPPSRGATSGIFPNDAWMTGA